MRFLPAMCGLMVFLASLNAAAATHSDEFIRGYVTAILETQYQTPEAEVSVEKGVVSITLSANRRFPEIERKMEANGKNRGIVEVRVTWVAAAPTATVQRGVDWFPEEKIFRPLMADPRWPHFYASYQQYYDTPGIESVGSVGFGETFAIAGGDLWGGRWQAGAQFGVFAVFDMDSDSHDLINADYWVGIPFIYRRGPFSSIARIHHMSSHLGDEYLLRGEEFLESRENLSYEALSAVLSYDLTQQLRLYGGGEYIFHQSFEDDTKRDDLAPWSAQFGGDYIGPPLDLKFGGVDIRFVAGADFRTIEEANWNTDVSLQAGFDFSGPGWHEDDRSLRILLEFFDGRSPHGQFYDRDISYIGLGAHLNY